MSKTAILAIKIISDNKQAKAGLEETGASTAKLDKAMGQATIASAALLGGITLMGKAAFDSADHLQQASGAVQSVFGGQAGAIDKLAGAAANAVGLSKASYSELASIIGAQLGNMGISTDKLVGTTDSLITKGADLAATFGGTTAEAVSALSALMRGETDPVERYGISIKQSDIQARLASQGLDKLTGAGLVAATTQAKLALLNEQTGAATGQFAREADSAAGAMQIASAVWENASAQLGQSLLPLVVQASGGLQAFAGVIQQNSDVLVPLIGTVAALAAGVVIASGAVKAWETITAVFTAAQWLMNAALAANPIGLAVVAVGLLIAALVLAYNNVGWFKDAVDNMGKFVGDIFNWIGDRIAGAISGFKDLLGWLGIVNNSPAPAAGSGQQQQQAQTYAAPMTMSAQPMMMSYAAPMTMSTASAAPSAPTMAGALAARADTRAQTVYNVDVTVQAAYDKRGTAQEIRDMLNSLDRTNGKSVVTGGGRW